MPALSIKRVALGVVRYSPMVALDGLLAVGSYAIALVLRFGGEVPRYYLDWFVVAAPVIAATYCLANVAFQLYRRVWRYASLPDLFYLTLAVGSATTILFLADALAYPQDHPMPLSTMPIGGALTHMAFGVTKFSPRIRRFLAGGLFPRGNQGMIIVGAGQAGQLLAREMLRHHEWNYWPVCYVDDDPAKRGLRIHGVPVAGPTTDLPRLVKAYRASAVAFAIPTATSARMRSLVDLCQPLPVRLLVVPDFPRVLQGTDSPVSLREIRIEDLLGRDPVHVDLAACRDYVGDRTVLITGAAGSIGSELSRQVLALGPATLVLFDNNESALHDLAVDLKASTPTASLLPVVGNVTDRAKVDTVFRQQHPQVVFHAAAYKHVPLMEDYPEEAITTNVLGTNTVARAAHRYGAERFVLVSTDKAVSPSNVMGATKRLAELIVKDLAASSSTVFCAVRFGNVLGSRGSVIPLFARQIERGGPITITDPNVTRFFMTIPEAVSLIIQAGSFATPGDIFVLDMGQPVRIVDLAEKMVRFRGLRLGKDIPVVFTGLRPGEKIAEELVASTETVHSTSHPKVRRLSGDCRLADISARVAELASLVTTDDLSRLRATLMEIVSGSQGSSVQQAVVPDASRGTAR